jgi:hypothetical protein
MKGSASDILPFANFDGTGSRVVGNEEGALHKFGVYDLAGNAREWIFNFNLTTSGRLIAGGGWNDFDYVFSQGGLMNTPNPMNRNITNGFRCIKLMDDGNLAQDEKFFHNFGGRKENIERIQLVCDSDFKMILHNYDYDNTPLNAKIEYSKVGEEWTEQKISFNTSYGDERMSAYLFLPHNSKPPYQCIVHHPGTGSRRNSSSEGNTNIKHLDYIVKTGRAALFPVLKGMYERNDFGGELKIIGLPDRIKTGMNYLCEERTLGDH